jgi:hypothetical protein
MTLPRACSFEVGGPHSSPGWGDTLRHNGESWHTGKCQAFHSTQIGHFAVPFIP